TSRLPVVSGMTGSQAGFGNAFGAVNAVGAAAQALAAGLPFAAAVATGAAVGQQRAAALGGNLSAATAQQYATIGANTLLTGCNQLGSFGLGQVIRGWELKNTWQAQLTATQVFANVLKASQAVLLFEAAADYIPGLEDEFNGGPVGRGLRYDGPGTNLSGNP